MIADLDVRQDWHTHTDWSDDATSSLKATVEAATSVGLTSISITDHVRASSTWVPEYAAAVAGAAATARSDITVRCGVEAKMLDSRGTLDLPAEVLAGRVGALQVNIADHQYPSREGPLTPTAVRALLADGRATSSEVIETLVTATACAATRTQDAVIAHLFSLLPKVGLSESDVSEQHLNLLADACIASGTAVEVNEKWRCPSPRTIARLTSLGVRLVAGSDAHRAEDVGRYRYVAEAAGASVGRVDAVRTVRGP